MRFGIVGLAKSGQAAHRLLKILGVKDECIATFDEKDSSAQFQKASEFLNTFQPQTLIVTPGFPLQTPWIQDAQKRGIKITSELALALEHLLEEDIIAITGSVGKSTVTALLFEGAKTQDPHAFIGGNFGVPLATYIADCLEGKRERANLLVLELSSYQLENCGHLKPRVSVITYLSPNHLERYPSLEAYYDTKLQLASRTQEFVALNSFGGDLKEYFAKNTSKQNLSANVYWTDSQLPQGTLLGKHNQENLNLANLVAQKLKWSEAAFEKMKLFGGLSHRLETFGRQTGIFWINDSKATSMDSVSSAIDSILEEKGRLGFQTLWVLLGGRDKKLPWSQLAKYKNIATERNVQFCFFGEFGEEAKLQSGLPGRNWKSLSDLCESLPWLVSSKDAVLLSPGGTSLDEFKGFEARGDYFKNTVLDFYKLQNLVETHETFTSDSREGLNAKSLFIALKGEKTDAHDLIPMLIKQEIGAIVAEESRRHLLPQDSRIVYVQDTHKAHRWLAGLFRRKCASQLKVFAIGGSSGKTSTKEFLFTLLSQKASGFKTLASQNGEKGIPKTWEQLRPHHRFAVIEVGIDAPLEMLKHSLLIQPDLAVLTSIGEEHLNLLKNIDRVFEEEKILFEETWNRGGHCFAPANDAYLAKLQHKNLRLVPIVTMPELDLLPNQYAKQNAQLAKACSIASGLLSEADWPQFAKSLELPEGRGRTLTIGNLTVIADHYNSNPSSLSASLHEGKRLAQRTMVPFYVWIGDMLDLGDETERYHQQLHSEVVKLADKVLCVGPQWKKLAPATWMSFENSSQPTPEDLKNFLGENPKAILLIKGSRGIKMERLLHHLTTGSDFKST